MLGEATRTSLAKLDETHHLRVVLEIDIVDLEVVEVKVEIKRGHGKALCQH